MEMLTIISFCIVLILCIVFNVSILYALIAGVIIFCIYGRLKGNTLKQLAVMIISGVKTAKNILIVFVLIGMLTALWRACGTIPMIICYAVRLIHPRSVVLMSFLLNCGVSVLTGTSFGTAATMGVICMTMAVSMGANPILAGGAILSGVYFGDRCSPVSTSALLVSELTGTSIFENIKRMLRTALLPFLLTCGIYAAAGFMGGSAGETADLQQLFSREMTLHGAVLAPAILILVLSALRINVKMAMSASIASAIALCLGVQHMAIRDILALMVQGFHAADREVGIMLNGGGIISMLKVMAIVCISSSYAGIFQKTGLLNGIKEWLVKISARITPFGGMLVTSLVAGMIACNQALTIMLTHQLCNDIEPDRQELAVGLENSAVVVAPLIPWSIAGAVPLDSVGAPTRSLFAACFLYLLPLYILLCKFYGKRTETKSRG